MLSGSFSGRLIAQAHRCHAHVECPPDATRHQVQSGRRQQRKLPIELLEMQTGVGRTRWSAFLTLNLAHLDRSFTSLTQSPAICPYCVILFAASQRT
jgi:hypothetical protein